VAGVAGLEPTIAGSKPAALPTWLYPNNIKLVRNWVFAILETEGDM
jgi:hypothetical protein